MAIIKAATAATESPAICAGVISGRSSFVAGAATEVGVDDAVDVADAGNEIESTKTD
jgi:isopentenyl diphosphate isomerase/L-lactate dehydrogenase-like FMN-dependent dehydrogenase